MEQEQALISKKGINNGFSVNRKVVNSKLYHDKFAKLKFAKAVTEALYHEAGRLLEKADGNEFEYMIAIDARNGRLVVDNFSRQGLPTRTGFSEEEYQRILDNGSEIIILHNHSYNRMPSGKDIVSFSKNEQIKCSIVLCHDGEVYAIGGAKNNVADIYYTNYNNFKRTYDDMMAKVLATAVLYETNNSLHLFDIERL
jgi:hypothetical protein